MEWERNSRQQMEETECKERRRRRRQPFEAEKWNEELMTCNRVEQLMCKNSVERHTLFCRQPKLIQADFVPRERHVSWIVIVEIVLIEADTSNLHFFAPYFSSSVYIYGCWTRVANFAYFSLPFSLSLLLFRWKAQNLNPSLRFSLQMVTKCDSKFFENSGAERALAPLLLIGQIIHIHGFPSVFHSIKLFRLFMVILMVCFSFLGFMCLK